MSKERLEEIKEKYNFGSIDRFVDVKLVNPQELKWLIEQAERVQELKDHKSILQLNLSLVLKKKQRLEQQNKRYREAIESMKSEINYALHSKKSKDVKRHYLENAIKYADKALEESK